MIALSDPALRDFRMLWLAQGVSSVGDQIFLVAIAFRVVEGGGDAGDVGLVIGGRMLAMVVFVLVGGAWADRLPRRWVMLGADVVRLLCIGAFLFAPATADVRRLAVLTFVVGAGEAFFRPAAGGLVPSIVPADRLAAVNSVRGATESAAAVLGPAAGGVLIAVASTSVAFAVNAATFAVSALCLLAVREPARPVPRRSSMLREIGAGLGAVRRTRWVSAVLAVCLVQALLVLPAHMALLPVVANEALGGSSAYGIVLAALSLSGFLATLAIGRWQPRRPGTVAMLFLSLFALVPMVLLTPFSLGWVVAGYVVAGLGFMPFNVLWETAVQRQFPAALLGRVSALDWLVSLALLPLGLILIGPLTEAMGRTVVLSAAAVLQVAAVGLALLVPGVRRFHDPDVVY